ncbi:hypothetical protein DICVIV_11182 [Dictyocaulus viviparus]|uniref:Multifunctional methyltransferase subunit TRM112-like protein n=1 Tax=Dictyocaulus viviparus TaxID=29172 RepID=A0A0D8XDZ4_DICVI|nr:hypothetical protein DICVIV_11182 [Dictyocaulus viviparus]
MKLLTHNFLSSRFLKNVTNGYPLILRANQKANKEVEFNEKFVLNMMPKVNTTSSLFIDKIGYEQCDFMRSLKVDYASLYNAALSIGEAGNMPAALPEDWETNVPVLMELHRVMLCVEIVDGELECPDTGRKFPIKDGIPNLLVSENEV